MVQMALQSRAVVPDGTASVSSVFIILQGEERERAIEREKVGERSGIQEPIKEPQLALIPPAGHSLSSSHLKVVLFSFSDFCTLSFSFFPLHFLQLRGRGRPPTAINHGEVSKPSGCAYSCGQTHQHPRARAMCRTGQPVGSLHSHSVREERVIGGAGGWPAPS